MAKRKNSTASASASGANAGYETELWQMADALPPQLISGDVRVKDAQGLVSEVHQ